MEERPLGNTGMSVPVVGMGTWKTFDVEGAERNARRRLVREALDLGLRLYDSSPMYGPAEEVLADALRARRDEAIVATKVWAASAEEGRRQIERSLEWYGGEVEIYQVHNLRLWKDHLAELEKRKQQDEVRAIGVTHYNHNAFDELEEVIRTGRLDMVQIPYNVIDRVVEKKILPLVAKQQLGVLVMEPLGTGALARKSPAPEELSPYLDEHVTTWPQVCLKWILSDPRVTAVIPATSSAAHMRDNVAAGEGDWYDEKEREAIAGLVA
ncbi:MAG TPA: aldo/keto reductase [Candidatus Thermoplasmatota archaeon]|nr:aldo/keto reductase [Candidatus Thermoplasmatota archaeon]